MLHNPCSRGGVASRQRGTAGSPNRSARSIAPVLAADSIPTAPSKLLAIASLARPLPQRALSRGACIRPLRVRSLPGGRGAIRLR